MRMRLGPDVSDCAVMEKCSAGASYLTSRCVRLSRLTAPVQLGGPEMLVGVSAASGQRPRMPHQSCDPGASHGRR